MWQDISTAVGIHTIILIKYFVALLWNIFKINARKFFLVIKSVFHVLYVGDCFEKLLYLR